VNHIIKAEKQNKPVEALEDFVDDTPTNSNDYTNVVGQDSLTRFDKPKRKKRRNKRKPRQHNRRQKNSNKNA
ncbi:MAG: hypothetical protein GVY05_07270, partial [Bacteroidetes bacterium]|nr:hypothetical protein [Bacteroidota bacterium]